MKNPGGLLRLLTGLSLLVAACGTDGATAPDGGGDVRIGKPDLPATLSDTGVLADLRMDLSFPDVAAPDAGVLCQQEEGFGCACENNGDCLEGWCVDSPLGHVCSTTCVEECPLGWRCVEAGAGADPVWVCLPQNLWLCRPCTASQQCHEGLPENGDACVLSGDAGAFCGSRCTQADECPEGFVCEERETVEGGFVQQCVPAQGECACTPKFAQAGSTTACAVTNELGSCPGQRQCTPDGLSDCDAPVPAKETCNGLDDDCDGAIDEEVAGEACTGDNGCPGTAACVDGNWACEAGQPTAESCNGQDDDCDGDTDEEGAAGCLYYYVDQDQDGFGGLAAGCVCGPTTEYPAEFANDCDDNNADVNPGAVEQCATPGDDNCDGITNQTDAADCTEFFLDQDQDGYGFGAPVCQCKGEGTLSAVLGGDCQDGDPAVHPGAEEACDGVDNNCDGAIDEGAPDSDDDGLADCADEDDDNDGTLDPEDCQPLNPAVPDCAGKQCGADGCGGNCGDCPPGHACQNGFCVCAPQCGGKICGSDGCGGSCGTCPVGYVCDNGACACLPQCGGKQCGPDGCGGTCGTCPAGYQCIAGGQCQALPNPCGTIDFAGQCAGNTLQYCHAAGNPNSPCYNPPNCQLAVGDCNSQCIQSGYSWGFCECGFNALCAPENYCCYCTCS